VRNIGVRRRLLDTTRMPALVPGQCLLKCRATRCAAVSWGWAVPWSLSGGGDSSSYEGAEKFGGREELAEEASSGGRAGWDAGRGSGSGEEGCLSSSARDEEPVSVGEPCFADGAAAWGGGDPTQGIGASLGGSGLRPECEIHVSRIALNARMQMPYVTRLLVVPIVSPRMLATAAGPMDSSPLDVSAIPIASLTPRTSPCAGRCSVRPLRGILGDEELLGGTEVAPWASTAASPSGP
jgi:hypothetical protein